MALLSAPVLTKPSQMATPEELKQELRNKRAAQLEAKRLAEESDNANTRSFAAVKRLVFLGYSFEQILHGSDVSETYLRWVYQKAHLPVPSARHSSRGQVQEVPSAVLPTSTSVSRFGSSRWINDVKFNLSDSSDSEDYEDYEFAGKQASASTLPPQELSRSSAVPKDRTPPAAVEAAHRLTTKPHVEQFYSTRNNLHDDTNSPHNVPRTGEFSDHSPLLQDMQNKRRLVEAQLDLKARELDQLDISSLKSRLSTKELELQLERQALERALNREHVLRQDIAELDAVKSAVDTEIGTLKSRPQPPPQTSPVIQPPGPIETAPTDTDQASVHGNNNEHVNIVQSNASGAQEGFVPLTNAADPDDEMNDDSSIGDEAMSDIQETSPLEAENTELIAYRRPEDTNIPDWPLKVFQSWRFSPANISHPERSYSPTFNARWVHDLENRLYCATEAAGYECTNPSCEDVHAKEFHVNTGEIFKYMGKQWVGPSKHKFLAGFKQRLRSGNQSSEVSYDHIARTLLEYRHEVDPFCFLAWTDWNSDESKVSAYL